MSGNTWEKFHTIKGFMILHPVTKLEPGNKYHARHALANGEIDRGWYEELLGYVIHLGMTDEEKLSFDNISGSK